MRLESRIAKLEGGLGLNDDDFGLEYLTIEELKEFRDLLVALRETKDVGRLEVEARGRTPKESREVFRNFVREWADERRKSKEHEESACE